jgi:hypothetical protein
MGFLSWFLCGTDTKQQFNHSVVNGVEIGDAMCILI